MSTNDPARPGLSATAVNPLPPSLILLLATAAGLAVAALYYNQPILGALGADIGASGRQIGFIPTFTQLGYALGILFLAPLGDRFDRRKIILLKSAVLCAALLAASAAPGIGVLLAMSLAIGISATLAQDIVPAAASIAPEASRGKVVGTVMTGLLLGILLSRVVSGLVSAQWGWRTMFAAAAVSIALIGAAAWRGLPSFKATTQLPYGALLVSLGTLWKRHAALRQASLSQGLLSVAFSAFWSTLAVMLHAAPFHLGSGVAGAFGLAGAAGAMAAPLAGRLSDQKGPELVTRLGASLVLASFAVMMIATMASAPVQLAVLVGGAIVFDLGIQATLIAHQSIIYSLEPDARSRLNAVLITSMFMGMAIGSAIGAFLLAQWGWIAVTALATIASAIALAIRLGAARKAASGRAAVL